MGVLDDACGTAASESTRASLQCTDTHLRVMRDGGKLGRVHIGRLDDSGVGVDVRHGHLNGFGEVGGIRSRHNALGVRWNDMSAQ